MGNCGTREESSVVSNAHHQGSFLSFFTDLLTFLYAAFSVWEQQLWGFVDFCFSAVQQQGISLANRIGIDSKKHSHSRSTSDLSDPSTPRNLEDFRKNAVLYTNIIAFTLFELETITKSFRSDYILGEGGFGTVYKGYIDENVRVGLKSLPVAVKVLNKEGLQGHREWLTEVSFLGQLRHPNLVKLIGYCCEDDHRLLVYEFMFRGSLENHLFRSMFC